jgi:GT2 family glycosyltransferase
MFSSASIAVIIPTVHGRQEYLHQSLNCINLSDEVELDIFVVTSTNKLYHSIISNLFKSMSLSFFHLDSQIRSAAVQRNIGLHFIRNLLSAKYKYIFFLDDDVLITKLQIKKLIESLEKSGADGISGVTRSYQNLAYKVANTVRSFFGLSSLIPGVVNKFGINVEPHGKGIIKVEWLIGCSIWKYESLQNHYFFSEFDRYTLAEDVLFSYRLHKLGKKLVVDCDVVFDHLLAPKEIDKFDLIQKLLASRLRLCSLVNMSSMSYLWFRIYLVVDYPNRLLRNVKNLSDFKKTTRIYLNYFFAKL